MASWRTNRQLIILLIILIPLAGVGAFLIWRLVPAPACTDGLKNQGELGTDCGGPCAPCELKNPKPITVFWTRAVRVRNDTFDVAAFIENQNEILSSPRVQYEFTLFDSFGPVAARSGSTFLLAQERTHVIEAGVKTTREPVRVEFRVTGVSWQLQKEERLNVLVERRDHRVIEDNGRTLSTVETNILNQTPFDLKEVMVHFTVLDKEGNLLGANRVLVERLLSGESRFVKSIWPSVFAGNIAAIEVEPRTNILAPDIILKPR